MFTSEEEIIEAGENLQKLTDFITSYCRRRCEIDPIHFDMYNISYIKYYDDSEKVFCICGEPKKTYEDERYDIELSIEELSDFGLEKLKKTLENSRKTEQERLEKLRTAKEIQESENEKKMLRALLVKYPNINLDEGNF